jgi:hypothetical protein
MTRSWWVALLAALSICVALLPLGMAVRVIGVPVVSRSNLISITVGGVWCPTSAIGGWVRGYEGVSLVTNVVTCGPSDDKPAAWLLLGWRDGSRTSLCLDFEQGRC